MEFLSTSNYATLAECTQHCWDRKKISCFSPFFLPAADDPDADAGSPTIKFTNQILFFTALASALS